MSDFDTDTDPVTPARDSVADCVEVANRQSRRDMPTPRCHAKDKARVISCKAGFRGAINASMATSGEGSRSANGGALREGAALDMTRGPLRVAGR